MRVMTAKIRKFV